VFTGLKPGAFTLTAFGLSHLPNTRVRGRLGTVFEANHIQQRGFATLEVQPALSSGAEKSRSETLDLQAKNARGA